MARLLTTIGLLMAMATSAFAEGVTLEMWNKDPDNKKRKMVFSQEIVTILTLSGTVVDDQCPEIAANTHIRQVGCGFSQVL